MHGRAVSYEALPAVPPALAALGWAPQLASALEALGDGELLPMRVQAADRGSYELLGADGPMTAALAGRVRHDAGPGELPVVGDWVAVEPSPPTIRHVLERRTVLRRAAPTGALQVLAANVDVVFVVSSLNRDLDARRLEQFVAVAADGGAQPVVVLTKSDLLADPSAMLAQVRPVTRGVPLVIVSAQRGEGLEELAPWLTPGSTAALLGASGVGKSTLVNALLGEERQTTAPIKRTSDQGRHTTVRRELIVLPSGALLVDAPGLRLPELWAPEQGLAAAFADLDALAEDCRFSDCAHRSEPGCAVRAAIDAGELDPGRLAGFLELEEQTAGRTQRPWA
ncbi:MAG: ribosome small subunit-dependent GTPase [Solirubrobacterales bacterium]|nr:ribosome small subunit-dependent GTPase [Solirubrobacterales bacterium]